MVITVVPVMPVQATLMDMIYVVSMVHGLVRGVSMRTLGVRATRRVLLGLRNAPHGNVRFMAVTAVFVGHATTLAQAGI